VSSSIDEQTSFPFLWADIASPEVKHTTCIGIIVAFGSPSPERRNYFDKMS